MPLDCCHMKDMLSCEEFMEQQDILGSAYATLVQFEGIVQSGFDLIVNSTNITVEVALLNPYARTLERANPELTAGVLREAVVALETHISVRSGFTINEYLSTNSLKVTQDFATLSALVGVSINSDNIEV